MRLLIIALACVVALIAGILAVSRIGIYRAQAAHDGLAQEGNKIVHSIEAFTASHGRLPTNITELVPDFMPLIPPISKYSAWELLTTPGGYALSCHGQLPHCYIVYRYFSDQPEHSFWEENWEGAHRRITVPENKEAIEQHGGREER